MFLLLQISPLLETTANAAPTFANSKFQELWEYSDKPVVETPGIGRGFTWGPNSFGVFQEDYAEASGGKRQVQYFDKSRMELAPDGSYVTNGLLTKELVTGRRQDGNQRFVQLSPSTVQIAGDDNSAGANSVSPTYASFQKVVSFSPGQNAATARTGQLANLAITKDGRVSTGANLPAQLVLSTFEPTFKHNVPKVFVDFENLTGQVWSVQRRNYQTQKIYTDNPVANVFGLPISEAYWVRAVVAGQEKDVLVQLFERRVLTYTPSNNDPFKVEMGNIGQHYYRWRYSTSGGGTGIAVLTQHNDNSRTGANLAETILNTANVNSKQFGKLFSRPVDGQIYTQPLYVPSLPIPGRGTHNVVFVATQHNSVYAFDADDPKASEPLWHVNLGPSAPTPNDDFGNQDGLYNDISPEVGITSTPVIDLNSETIYVVPFTKENGHYYHRLHALDLLTGQEKPNSPVTISGSVAGSGAGSHDGVTEFDSKQHLQRPGLLLSKGIIYLGFGSYADTDPYHGWVMGYDATSLQQVALYNTTPDGWQGAVWQSGQGISADQNGNLYLITGNGTFGNSPTGRGLGNSFIKLSPSPNGLTVQDWFTTFNYDYLNDYDYDIGSTGVLLIPDTNLLLGGDKQGTLYLLNRDNFGRYHPNDNNQITQSFQASKGPLFGSPIYWNSPDKGPLIYIWGTRDQLKAYRLSNGLLQTTPASATTLAESDVPRFPGGFLSLSANGNNAGSGIIWATHPVGSAGGQTVPGVLRAYDASDLSRELWNSQQNPADSLGNFAKFCPPTIVNGKVYVATFSNQLVVYGLRS